MLAAPAIRVSALQEGRLARDIADFRPTHVVSLLDPSLAAHRIPSFPDEICSFQRAFYDVEDAQTDGPVAQVVSELVAFLTDWSRNAAGSRLITHCHMGASRSTAAAYLALAIHHGPGAEVQAFEAFLQVANKPWPNLRMVTLADQILDRGGAVVAPLHDYRQTYPGRIDAYRRLNLKRGIFR